MKKNIIKFISLFIILNLVFVGLINADENETINETVSEPIVTTPVNDTVESTPPVNDITESSPTQSTQTNNGVIIEEHNGYKLIINDEANLLTYDEKILLKYEMEKVTQYGNVAFITINQNSFGSATKYNENYYYKTFGRDSGIVLLIDMATREIIISSDGYIDTIVTKSKKDSIADNVYRYASYGKYYLTAIKSFEQINKLLDGGKILEPMKIVSNIFISLVLGFILCLFHILKVSNIEKASKDEILKKCVAAVAVANIVATKTGTKKIYSPPSSSSSSGGSFGGGGGFSGGGGFGGSSGGHRF